MNTLKIAEEYANKLHKAKEEGKDIGQFQMVYAEEMSKRCKIGYVEAKELARFCYDGFQAKGLDK